MPYATNSKQKDNFFCLKLFIIIGIGGSFLFTIIGLFEFYNIEIANKVSEYPFGLINHNPWYYQTSTIYSNYNLISAMIFLIILLVILWAITKKKRKLTILMSCLTILLIILQFISSKVQIMT